MADDDVRRERERVVADAIQEAKNVARNEAQSALREVLREHNDNVRDICREVFVAEMARAWDVRPDDFRDLRIDIRAAATAHKRTREMGGSAFKSVMEEVVKAAVAALMTGGAIIFAIKGFH